MHQSTINMKEKVIFSWSCGKDSALALYELCKSKQYEIVSLLTVLTKDYNRVSMHGVRKDVLHAQIDALGFPLKEIYISKSASNDEYEKQMESALGEFKEKGVTGCVFADIFLEDLRRYREEKLSKVGMKGIFPLWKKDTIHLAHRFIDVGFTSMITCVDLEKLDRSFCGRVYEKEFISELPVSVDPCGENGEFHSCVVDGPIFTKPLRCSLGEKVVREGRFSFSDIFLAS